MRNICDITLKNAKKNKNNDLEWLGERHWKNLERAPKCCRWFDELDAKGIIGNRPFPCPYVLLREAFRTKNARLLSWLHLIGFTEHPPAVFTQDLEMCAELVGKKISLGEKVWRECGSDFAMRLFDADLIEWDDHFLEDDPKILRWAMSNKKIPSDSSQLYFSAYEDDTATLQDLETWVQARPQLFKTDLTRHIAETLKDDDSLDAVRQCFETAIKNGCVWHKNVCDILIERFGSQRDRLFQLLKTVCALGCKVSQSVVDKVAREGNLEMFKWAVTANGSRKRWVFDINCVVEMIGGKGSQPDTIEMLKTCFEKGYKSFGYYETHAAELQEKYDVLKFLVENGCSWKPQKYFSRRIAKYEDEEFLKWVARMGVGIYRAALKRKSFELMKILVDGKVSVEDDEQDPVDIRKDDWNPLAQYGYIDSDEDIRVSEGDSDSNDEDDSDSNDEDESDSDSKDEDESDSDSKDEDESDSDSKDESDSERDLRRSRGRKGDVYRQRLRRP